MFALDFNCDVVILHADKTIRVRFEDRRIDVRVVKSGYNESSG